MRHMPAYDFRCAVEGVCSQLAAHLLRRNWQNISSSGTGRRQGVPQRGITLTYTHTCIGTFLHIKKCKAFSHTRADFLGVARSFRHIGFSLLRAGKVSREVQSFPQKVVFITPRGFGEGVNISACSEKSTPLYVAINRAVSAGCVWCCEAAFLASLPNKK